MKRFLIDILIIGLLLSTCHPGKRSVQKGSGKNKTTTHNSRNSADWTGVYRGTLVCADCEGIQTEIRLNEDLTYEITMKYLGRDTEIFKNNGTFRWDDSGGKIVLVNLEPVLEASHFLVGENMLIKLDKHGNRIHVDVPGRNNLKKVFQDNNITDKYWKLVELSGKGIQTGESPGKTAHFILRSESTRIYGNGGCNTFSGAYALTEEYGIRFSNLVSTKMACKNMEIEDRFFIALERAEGYRIHGDTLFLVKAGMNPMARFIYDYFH